jgi:hypothetical protein
MPVNVCFSIVPLAPYFGVFFVRGTMIYLQHE